MSEDRVQYFDLTSDERINDGLLWRDNGRPFYDLTLALTADEIEAGDLHRDIPVGPGVTAPASCAITSSDGCVFLADIDEVRVIDGQRMAAVVML